MLSFVKINLNGGLKRLASTLICLMMVLVTFPMHMISSTVRADGGDPITLTLSTGSEVTGWMGTGKPLDSATVPNAGDINITLSEDITVAEPSNNMGGKYFFNFTDGRFAGKTITIDGTNATEEQSNHTIKIDSADLFFLNLKDCRVILKNITIDGNSIVRGSFFIFVAQPTDANASSELVIEDETTIQNCQNKNSSSMGGGICVGGKGTVTMNGTATISGCIASTAGGGIYVNSYGTVTMNDTAKISGCSASGAGGGIYVNSYGTVTMNDNATISDCTATSGSGGGVFVDNNGTVTMNDTATISGCSALGGGGIYVNSSGTVTMNGGKIIGCIAVYQGDAIYNSGTLNLHFREFGIFKIQLPSGHGTCSHNSQSENVMGYEGIFNGKTIKPISNYKIVFVDSESNSTVSSAYGNVPEDPTSPAEDEKISVPNSVLARPGYEFVEMSYTKSGETTATEITVTDGKFALNDDMIASAKNGVVTVKVKYNKLYTVQYICDNKVVGIKSGCSAETELSKIINETFSNIILDGEDTTTLASVVEALNLKAKGYEFSNLTYGNGQPYNAETTTWENLKDSAVDGLITVCVNHKRLYKVVATLSGFLGLDKSGVRGVYQH